MVALKGGGVFAAGPPEEVVTQSLLREVFGVEADIVPDPRSGIPICIPHGLHNPADGLSPDEAERRDA